eukprot:2876808-Rhodomonas_salina.4
MAYAGAKRSILLCAMSGTDMAVLCYAMSDPTAKGDFLYLPTRVLSSVQYWLMISCTVHCVQY